MAFGATAERRVSESAQKTKAADWRRLLEGVRGVEWTWNASLKRLNSFRLPGVVRCLARPGSVERLAALIRVLEKKDIPWTVFGNGSNVVVPSGTWNVVLILLDRCCGTLQWEEEKDSGTVSLKAGAGCRLSRVIRICARNGWSGLEGLVGIPAAVGGAVITNAGTRYGCMSDVLEEIAVMDTQGAIRRHGPAEWGERYRALDLPYRGIVLEAAFRLEKRDPVEIRKKLRRIMRERRATQPLEHPSAGCIFKNPPGSAAGALIDRAGLKGLRVGGAEVSRKHANWIVNRGGATGEDVRELIRRVKAEVERRFGVVLEEEVRVL